MQEHFSWRALWCTCAGGTQAGKEQTAGIGRDPERIAKISTNTFLCPRSEKRRQKSEKDIGEKENIPNSVKFIDFSYNHVVEICLLQYSL